MVLGGPHADMHDGARNGSDVQRRALVLREPNKVIAHVFEVRGQRFVNEQAARFETSPHVNALLQTFLRVLLLDCSSIFRIAIIRFPIIGSPFWGP